MKRKLLFVFLSFTVLSTISYRSFSQDSAVWALTTTVPTNAAGFTYTGSSDSAAYHTALVVPDSVVFSNMKGGYSPSKFKPSSGPNQVSGGTLPGYPMPYPEATYSMWRLTNTDQGGVAGNWPAESAYTPTRYFQFNVTAAAGKEFHVTSVKLPLGGATTGNIRADIYYSIDNFATSTLLATGVPLAKDTVQVLTYAIPGVVVKPTYKFSLRVYPWFSSTSTGSTKSIWAEAVAIYGFSAVLPVTFSNIAATKAEGGVDINWGIATEINTDHYTIERSTDGATFSAIGTVAAAGAGNYKWTDALPAAGVNVYRIKAVDKDGSYQYSASVSINTNKQTTALSVYPNPVVGGHINVQLSGFDKGVYTLQLLGINGQVVATRSVSLDGSISSLSMQVPSNVSTGIYQLQLNNGVTRVAKTILLQ